MDKIKRGKIRMAFAQVLEKLAIPGPQPLALEDFNPGEWVYLAGAFAFKGHSWGKIILVLPKELAGRVSEKFMVANSVDSPPGANPSDALKQFLKVICTQLLSGLQDAGDVFELSVPQLEEISPDHVGEMSRRPESIAFRIEDYPVLLLVEFDSFGSELN